MKPEPDPSPKLEARTRLEPDILFLKPDLGLNAKLTEGVRYAQLHSNKKRLCAGVVAGTRFITPKIEAAPWPKH